MDSVYEKVGRTAFVICEWRAEESEHAAPLFFDNISNIFLNNETERAASLISKFSPSTRFLVRYRTRYFDDKILEKIKQGVRQFVILGSGLDTRPIRLAHKDVKFYEVEQAHVLEFKARQFQKYGYAQNSVFVPYEYTSVDFIDKLVELGFEPSLETFFLWEGNIFYLKYDNILYVLECLKRGIPKFELAFDYLTEKLITRSTGFERSNELLNGFSQIGAPWNTGFNDITKLAKEVGLGVKENFLIAHYANKIGMDFHVDAQLFDDYYISIFNQ
ncbi:class I SAM-dependent methyltransferase [Paenibacillus sp. NPDC055715]